MVLIGLFGLNKVKANSITTLKSFDKRRIWPIDWLDIHCPKCSKNTLGLTSMHKDKQSAGCICYSCRCDFVAIWDKEEKSWYYYISPLIENDWHNNWISLAIKSIDIDNPMRM